jgi:hypothetical protein
MTDLEQRVSEAIKETIGNQNLNKVLWKQGFQGQQGPTSVDYEVKCGRVSIEAAQYLKEMEDTFHSEYYKWHSDLHNYYMNGEDEDFNEETEGYTEDEMYEAVDEHIDCDGWVFLAYQAFVATIITEVMEEIKEEKFVSDYKEYRKKLESIEGLVVEDSYYYPRARYWDTETKVLNGFEVFTYEDDETTNDIETMYIEYSAEDGWSYNHRFDTFDELFAYLKENVKNLKKVA